MSGIDRRSFLALTAGALAAPSVLAESPAPDGSAPAAWGDAIIVNALGALDNPNPRPDGGGGPAGPGKSRRRNPCQSNSVCRRYSARRADHA